MFRRTLGAAVAVALLTTGLSYAAIERPREGCTRRVVDGENDAKYSLSTTGNVRDPRDPSVPAIDIVSVTLRHTEAAFEVHLRLKDLSGAFQPHETAYRYDVRFKNGDGTEILLQAMRSNATWDGTPARATGASQYPQGQFTVGTSVPTKFTDVAADVDATTGWIVFTVPAAEFAKAFSGGVSDGAALTGITADTFAYIPGTGAGVIRPADTASSADPLQGTYRVGEDPCFGPPPAVLSTTLTAPRVPFGDATALSAKLVSEAGAPLAGKPVRFAVTGEPVRTATTDANGVARTSFTPTQPAKAYPLTISFAGDATDGRVTLSGLSVTVVAEATRLAALKAVKTSVTGRTVSTTLTDDDGKALGRQQVAWYAGSKKLATTATTARGVATYKGAKAGQTLVAKFGGLTGRYAASASRPRKV